MTYAELLAEIKLLSKRGDIDDKIAVALRLTTLRCHRIDYFWRDRAEVDLTFSLGTEVTVDIATNFTRFRQMEYMRYLDTSNGALGSFLKPVEPSQILDDYNYFTEDAYFLAGTNLNARFLYATSGARVGYWQSPDVAAATYNSWIARELPDILIQGSLGYLFNMMGKQEEARAVNRLVGLDPDPANRLPGMTLKDQLLAIGLRQDGQA